jgi:streptogramin lyase
VGFGSVWVPDCDDQLIARIDPITNTVSGSIDIPVSGDKQFAVGEGAVWMPVGSDLMRIDPRTMKVVGKVPVGPELAGAVVGFGSVWVTSPMANKVIRVDPDTMRVLATVHVSGPSGIASGEGAIWTLNNSDGSLSRIDAGTDKVVATIPTAALGSFGMAVGLGSVWVSADTLPLAEIDAQTNEVIARYTTDFGANTVAVGFGSLWLPSPGFDAMWRLRPDP